MTDQQLLSLVEQHGTPLFVYDTDAMVARAEAVYAAFLGEVEVHYATKANAAPEVLRALQPHVAGADVTSVGALRGALEAGFVGAAVQYTSPGKSPEDLEAALKQCATVVLGCVDEAADLVAAATRLGLASADIPTLVRVNPLERIHAFRSPTGGVPSPFGIPEEELDEALPRLSALGLVPRGLHVHRGSQCTSATAFSRHVDATLTLAERLHVEHGLPLHINLGGGLGVAPSGSKELPLESLGRRCARSLRAFRAAHPSATFAIEPGRYLVAEFGTLALRVLRRRTARGTTFLVLDAGIDAFLFASERMRHGPPPPMRVLHSDATETTASTAGSEATRVTIVGPACTGEDTLVRDAELSASPGDVLLVEHAGAYAAGASVRGFLGRDPVREVPLTGAISRS
ncbi:MAG: hypothetical protein KDA24_14270 [Deltaproteobacteria bacterium]|nr:hypothetical protein [Deltaproteobacteria bacterium]